MPYVNNYQCCGHVVADPKPGEHNSGAYATFLVALNKPGAKRPVYVECIAWAESALRVLDHCHKGTEVFLYGELETSNYVDSKGSHRKSTTLRVEKFSVIHKEKDRAIGAIKRPVLPPLSE
jgi:single-stranded DNA-binding protein